MKGGIGDNIVLEETAYKELCEVIRNVKEDKLVTLKVVSAPCYIIRSDIVPRCRKGRHGLLKIVRATGIVKISLRNIISSSDSDKTIVMGFKEFWIGLKGSRMGLEPFLNGFFRCKELLDLLRIVQEILVRLKISIQLDNFGGAQKEFQSRSEIRIGPCRFLDSNNTPIFMDPIDFLEEAGVVFGGMVSRARARKLSV